MSFLQKRSRCLKKLYLYIYIYIYRERERERERERGREREIERERGVLRVNWLSPFPLSRSLSIA